MKQKLIVERMWCQLVESPDASALPLQLDGQLMYIHTIGYWGEP